MNTPMDHSTPAPAVPAGQTQVDRQVLMEAAPRLVTATNAALATIGGGTLPCRPDQGGN